MISSVTPVTAVTPLEQTKSIGAPASGALPDFQHILQNAIQTVEASATNAVSMMDNFLSGDTQDLHTVALAAQKAGLQLDVFLQVRNKLVQAYQEVMRMQL
jgi:flagellar hook-basal body complex protein FliE